MHDGWPQVEKCWLLTVTATKGSSYLASLHSSSNNGFIAHPCLLYLRLQLYPPTGVLCKRRSSSTPLIEGEMFDQNFTAKVSDLTQISRKKKPKIWNFFLKINWLKLAMLLRRLNGEKTTFSRAVWSIVAAAAQQLWSCNQVTPLMPLVSL